MAHIKVVSDTHFNHQKMIDFGIRDFEDSKMMDEVLIETWNSRVKSTDKVIHCGDFACGEQEDYAYIESICKRLNGTKILILGNHDTSAKVRDVYTKYFKCLGSLTWGDYYFTHEPVHPCVINPDQLRSTGRQATINVHGHLHNDDIQTGDYPQAEKQKYINVCLDVLGLSNMVYDLEV